MKFGWHSFFNRLLLICVALGLGLSCYAQVKGGKVDSLKGLLLSAKDDSTEGRIYRQLASHLKENKPTEAVVYADSAIKIGALINDTSLILDGNIAKGIALFHLAEYATALECQSRALDLALTTGNENQQAACYTNIGRIYSQQENQGNRAKEYYRKALIIREKYRDRQLPNAYLNLSTIFCDEKSYDSARYYAQKSIAAVADSTDQRILAYGYNTMGTIYFAEKDYANAVVWFEKSKGLKESLNDRKGLVSSYANIGESYAMMGQYDKGIESLNTALAIANSLRSKFLMREVYYTLSDVYKMKGDYKNAYDMFHLYTVYRDSIFNDEKSSEILELQEKFESSQKQRENELLKANNDIQAESILQKDRLNYVIIGCLILVLLGAVFLFRAYAQKKKANHEISLQKVQLEQKNKEVFDSISYAKRLQQAILATPEEINKYVPENFLFYKPKDIVAGDFYFFETTGSHIFIAAADCTGHGVPGAMMSIVCSNALTRCVKEFNLSEPGKILDKARELVVETFERSGQDVKDGMDISFLAIDRSTKELKWAGANNPLWVVEKSESQKVQKDDNTNIPSFQLSNYSFLEIKGNKQPIGKTENSKPFTTHVVSGLTSQVSCLYLCTDGYADQFGGPKGKKFKYKQLQELLIANGGKSLEEQQRILENAFEEWRGNLEQVDDVCVIGVRI